MFKKFTRINEFVVIKYTKYNNNRDFIFKSLHVHDQIITNYFDAVRFISYIQSFGRGNLQTGEEYIIHELVLKMVRKNNIVYLSIKNSSDDFQIFLCKAESNVLLKSVEVVFNKIHSIYSTEEYDRGLL